MLIHCYIWTKHKPMSIVQLPLAIAGKTSTSWRSTASLHPTPNGGPCGSDQVAGLIGWKRRENSGCKRSDMSSLAWRRQLPLKHPLTQTASTPSPPGNTHSVTQCGCQPSKIHKSPTVSCRVFTCDLWLCFMKLCNPAAWKKSRERSRKLSIPSRSFIETGGPQTRPLTDVVLGLLVRPSPPSCFLLPWGLLFV